MNITSLGNTSIFSLLQSSVRKALPKGLRTAWWLIRITIPVSFGVLLLDYSGFLDLMAILTGPVFNFFGLPGTSAIVLITSIFTNIYSVVAVLTTLDLPVREGIIIGTMCLVSHNFIIETTVLHKTGSSTARMIFLRIFSSFIIGWFLNMVIPGSSQLGKISGPHQEPAFTAVLTSWMLSISYTTIKIIILVVSLLILQQILEDTGLVRWFERPFAPLLRIMGLPKPASISWLVANVVGLAYGSAIMINQVEAGKMKKAEADLLNHHIAVSHSQLEDPLLFLAIGYTIHWMIWPRVILAIIIVWLRRLELALKGDLKKAV